MSQLTNNKPGPYIIECINLERNERGKRSPNRKMRGPFYNFLSASQAMTELRPKYDTMILHYLYPAGEPNAD